MDSMREMFSGGDPKDQVKKWKQSMRGEARKVDRQIRGMLALACAPTSLKSCVLPDSACVWLSLSQKSNVKRVK